MNREEYEKKLAEKNAEIDKINKQINELKKQYCNDCSPFKVGDRVRFNGKEGVITSIYPSWKNFEYKWKPFRKDGSEGSEKNIWSFDFDKIEKI